MTKAAYTPTTSTAVAIDVLNSVAPAITTGSIGGGGTHQLNVRGARPWAQPLEALLEWPEWMDEARCHDRTRWDVFVPVGKAGNKGSGPVECGTCPVARQCLAQGIKTKSDGWWGGEYLNAGVVSSATSPSFTATTAADVKRREAAEQASAAKAARDKEWMRLYLSGLRDAEIGALVGMSGKTICKWRGINKLRVNGTPIATAKFDDCVNGHPFTPENTYIRPARESDGRRVCRQCMRDRASRYHFKSKAKHKEAEAA